MLPDRQSVLKIRGGKYVTVKKFPPGQHSLCAVDVQNAEQEAPSVDIYKRVKDQIIQLAFRFNSSLFLKVDEDNKSLTVTNSTPTTPDMTPDCWFVKEDLGSDHYGLKSVVQINKQYLKIETRPGSRKTLVFVLGDSKEECAHVTDVTKG